MGEEGGISRVFEKKESDNVVKNKRERERKGEQNEREEICEKLRFE